MIEWGNVPSLSKTRVAQRKKIAERRKQTRDIMQELNRDMYFKTPYDSNDTSNLPFDNESTNRIKNNEDFESELDEIIRGINFPQDKDKSFRNCGMDMHPNNSVVAEHFRSILAISNLKRGRAYKKAQNG